MLDKPRKKEELMLSEGKYKIVMSDDMLDEKDQEIARLKKLGDAIAKEGKEALEGWEKTLKKLNETVIELQADLEKNYVSKANLNAESYAKGYAKAEKDMEKEGYVLKDSLPSKNELYQIWDKIWTKYIRTVPSFKQSNSGWIRWVIEAFSSRIKGEKE